MLTRKKTIHSNAHTKSSDILSDMIGFQQTLNVLTVKIHWPKNDILFYTPLYFLSWVYSGHHHFHSAFLFTGNFVELKRPTPPHPPYKLRNITPPSRNGLQKNTHLQKYPPAKISNRKHIHPKSGS